jgi:sortase A
MKNSSNKFFLLVIILGGVLVATGIWFGFLSGYLKASSDTERAQQLFASPSELPTSPAAPTPLVSPEPVQLVAGKPELGEKFAIMRIPVLGADWARTISEGTSLGILDHLGIGHYEKTEFPGEQGNFAVAGHSGNQWTPFARYSVIETGNLIEVETFDKNFVYKVVGTKTVNEKNMNTIYKNPSLKNAGDGDSWLTITTCLTDGPDNKRYVIYAKLISSEAKT